MTYTKLAASSNFDGDIITEAIDKAWAEMGGAPMCIGSLDDEMHVWVDAEAMDDDLGDWGNYLSIFEPSDGFNSLVDEVDASVMPLFRNKLQAAGELTLGNETDITMNGALEWLEGDGAKWADTFDELEEIAVDELTDELARTFVAEIAQEYGEPAAYDPDAFYPPFKPAAGKYKLIYKTKFSPDYTIEVNLLGTEEVDCLMTGDDEYLLDAKTAAGLGDKADEVLVVLNHPEMFTLDLNADELTAALPLMAKMAMAGISLDAIEEQDLESAIGAFKAGVPAEDIFA